MSGGRTDARLTAGSSQHSQRRPGWSTFLWRLIASLVIFGAVAESGIRVVDLGHAYESAPDAYLSSADPDVLFLPRPGYHGFSEGTTVGVSSQGLRDREFSISRPARTVRILVLGDSVTFGFGVLSEDTFSKRLEERLNQRDRARTYEVINAGVSAYNTVQERARLEQVGLHLEPDIVVLVFVVNDLLDTYSIFDHQYEPTGVLAPIKKWLRSNSHVVRFVQNMSWRLLGHWRQDSESPEKLRDRSRVLEREAEISRIAELSRARSAAFLLVLYPDNLDNLVSPDGQGRQLTVREELVDFASRNAFPWLDLTESLGNIQDRRSRDMRLREDPHPSPLGHQVIASALEQALYARGLLPR